jgi:hypothetical protein
MHVDVDVDVGGSLSVVNHNLPGKTVVAAVIMEGIVSCITCG